MIKPTCDCCGLELSDFGALLFSPPSGYTVFKFHVCATCYATRILPQLSAVHTHATADVAIPASVTKNS